METTEKNEAAEDWSEVSEKDREYIDGASYEDLLSGWRHAPVGAALFKGKTGDYYAKVMREKRASADHVAVSKRIGW